MDARRVVVVGAVAAVGILAPTAGAQAAGPIGSPAAGVVVGWRGPAHTATLALPGGRLVAVHTGRRVPIGTRVRLVRVHRLRNGTLQARLRPVGRVHRIRVRGTVVARLRHHALVLGTRGGMVVVHVGRRARHGARAMEFQPSGPQVGATVTAAVDVGASGDLETRDVTEVSAPSPGERLEIEGTLTALDPASRTLTVTSSDDDVTANFTVDVPAAFDLGQFTVGQERSFHVTLNADGVTYTLAGSSENEDAQQADDPSEAQGDECHHHDRPSCDRSPGASSGDQGTPADQYDQGDDSSASDDGGPGECASLGVTPPPPGS